MKITIKDIAEKSGVNISTVSRVLNNTASISQKVRDRVLGIAKELDYHPHAYAKNLAANKSWTISLVIPNFEFLTGSFFQEMVHGITDELNRRRYSLLVTPLESSSPNNLMVNIRSRKIDGALILGDSLTSDDIRDHTDIDFPTILLNRQNKHLDSRYVSLDNELGGELAAEHLIKHGYNDLVYIGGDEHFHVTQERLRGFYKAIDKAPELELRQKPRLHFVSFHEGLKSGYQTAVKLIPFSGTGVFAASDNIALGVMRYCQEKNIKVGTDVGIIGYDNMDVDPYIFPGLTSIEQNPVSLGVNGCKMLIDLIENSLDQDTLEIKPELVLRGSCGCKDFKPF